MNRELDFWMAVRHELERHDAVMLMVVAASSGSSPGRAGFKMVVTPTTLGGSIGGGVMEMELVRQARQLLAAPPKTLDVATGNRLVRQVHRKNTPDSSGMICSGEQSIVLVRLTQRDSATVGKIVDGLSVDSSPVLQITGAGFELTSADNQPGQPILERTREKDFIYRETLGFRRSLYLVGGGHCALALSEIMSRLDFRISLFDDRPNLNTVEKNRFADRKVILDSFENIDEFIPSGADNYVVVMTLGYKFDEIVIRRLFAKDFRYFGVLGSTAKMKTLLKTLENEGFDRERLARIRTPIGLPINSHSPEEIAISIAAEIISVKNSEN